MTDTEDAAERKPLLQRHQRHPQTGEPRRRLQFGTGYPHRGPAPACGQRPRTYQPPRPGSTVSPAQAGRLRVLQSGRERAPEGRP